MHKIFDICKQAKFKKAVIKITNKYLQHVYNVNFKFNLKVNKNKLRSSQVKNFH